MPERDFGGPEDFAGLAGEIGEPERVTKSEANYRTTGSGRRCKDCAHFRDPDECELVGGVISPQATCDLWESEDPEIQLFGGLEGERL